MKVKELADLISGNVLTASEAALENEVLCGMTSDLLDHALAHAAPGCAWLTVHTHMTVLAIAIVNKMSCVILPDGTMMSDAELKTADEANFPIISSGLSSFEICGIMYAHDIPAAQK